MRPYPLPLKILAIDRFLERGITIFSCELSLRVTDMLLYLALLWMLVTQTHVFMFVQQALYPLPSLQSLVEMLALKMCCRWAQY